MLLPSSSMISNYLGFFTTINGTILVGDSDDVDYVQPI